PAARVPIARAFEAMGVEVRARVGSIVSLAVPVPAIQGVASLPEVHWLKAARAYHLENEISTGSSFTASRDANATFGTKGAGVVVAVVDTGINYTKQDFRHSDGTTRVLGIWDQTLSDAAHPPPPGFGFGAFYSQADIDNALATSTTLLTGDGHGHGTHV